MKFYNLVAIGPVSSIIQREINMDDLKYKND